MQTERTIALVSLIGPGPLWGLRFSFMHCEDRARWYRLRNRTLMNFDKFTFPLIIYKHKEYYR